MDNKNSHTSKKKSVGWKKRVNITLSVFLLLGLLLSGFGGYTLAQSLTEKPSETITPENNEENNTTPENQEVIANTNIPGGEGLKNEMALNSSVKVFAEDAAEKINSSITSIEVLGNSFTEGDKLEIKLSKQQNELFGDLSYGDTFVLEGDGSSPLGETYILKVDSVNESNGETILRTSQPYLDEVFDTIALNINEAVKEENLVKGSTAEGVKIHFGSIEDEFENPESMGNISAGSTLTANDQTAPADTLGTDTDADGQTFKKLATEVSTEPNDLIITIDYDPRKAKTDDDDDDDSDLDIDADFDFKITGKFGIKDLSAYMVCDMPEPLQFNELFVGVRGEKFVNISVNAELSASFSGKATEVEADFLVGSAKASALNEKLFPLGIWQFAGTTPIKVTSSQYKALRVAPSIFLMLYSDWEGNISIKATASFEYKEAFNGGLRVVKDGKLAMNMENYPYNTGNEGETNDKGVVWSFGLELDANTDITLGGCSVLFCVGGLNIGEISLMRIGIEADCNLEVKASSDKGLETPTPQNSSYYLRVYVKVAEVKVRLKADIEVFWHDWGFEFSHEFCLLDLTLWKFGNMPEKYRPVKPVSTKQYPSSFDSVITLVCDVSGSMYDTTETGETKLSASKQAGTVITGIVENWSKQYPGNYGIGVVQFGSNAETLAFPHIDYPFIDQCIQSMSDGGGTNIAGGLEFGIEQLDNVKASSKVIILMTDGIDGNHTEILSQAEDAKAKGIRVFTVGFGKDTEEDILTQVADTTGGEYRFAATDNIVGIIGSFMYAQQASEAKVLADEQGTVSKGETTDVKSFKVPDESGDLNGILYWPGSVLDLIITDPNGRKVDENYPGAVIDKSAIPVTVVISDPLPGKWKMRIKGIETSYENEPYYAITSFKKIDRVNSNSTPKLGTVTLMGAYSLPVGFNMILISVMLLAFINIKKGKRENY